MNQRQAKKLLRQKRSISRVEPPRYMEALRKNRRAFSRTPWERRTKGGRFGRWDSHHPRPPRFVSTTLWFLSDETARITRERYEWLSAKAASQARHRLPASSGPPSASSR